MTKQLAYLDGFRGGAAFWVLAAHCAIWGGVAGVWIPDPKAAVDIFMIMSGFLMAYGSVQRGEREPVGRVRTWLIFYMRRYFRIAPVYYIVLIAAIVLQKPFWGGYSALRGINPERWRGVPFHDPSTFSFSLENIVTHFSFLFGLLPRYVASTGLPDWSIGLEMQFYLIFPILYLLMRKYGRLRLSVICILLAGFTMVTFKYLGGSEGIRGVFSEPSFIFLKLPLFIAGMLLCDAFFCKDITRFEIRFMLLIVAGIALLQFHHYGWLSLSILGTVVIMMSQLRGGVRLSILNKFTGAFLGNRITHFMAETSYSVYLMHGFFLSMIGAWLYKQPAYARQAQAIRYFLLLAVVAVCSYICAYFINKYIEKPGIAVGKRLILRINQKKPSILNKPA